jgi:hypothetical protein
MSKNKYTYYYPENKLLKAGLERGDYAVIAKNTGYVKDTVMIMLNGRRKLADKVKVECERIAELNSEKLKK